MLPVLLACTGNSVSGRNVDILDAVLVHTGGSAIRRLTFQAGARSKRKVQRPARSADWVE